MKKLILVLICMLFVSAFVNAAITLDKTSSIIEVDQGKTASTTLTITNNNVYDFSNVKLSIVDINSFMDSGDNQIAVSFSDNADNIGFVLLTSRTITISVSPEDDQYLGELTGEILITALKEGGNETTIFRLTVDTQADIVNIVLDDGDLDEEINPGDSATFSIDIENNAGYDLENIQITAWIVDIDDGDDIDLKSSKFDLDSSDNNEEDFDFDVPYNVDEESYDIKVRVKGEDADDSSNDFEVIKIFRGIVDVAKEEDEEIYLAEPSISVESLTCDSSFNVNLKAINIGTDDLDNVYLKLTIDGTNISIKSTEFDLDSDKYDDRQQNVDFLVKLPSKLDQKSYAIRILAYTEDDSVVGSVYKSINVNECSEVVDEVVDEETDEEPQEETTDDDEDNTVYLPTGWTTKFFSSETGKTIFWFMGNLALLVIIIYFIVALTRKKTVKK